MISMSVVKRLWAWRKHQPAEEAPRVAFPLASQAPGCTFLCVPQGEGWQGQCLANGGEAKAAFFPAALRWVSVPGMYTDDTVIKKHPFFFFSLDTKCPAEWIVLPKTHSNIHLRFSYWCAGRYTDVRFLSSFIQEIFQVSSNTDEQNSIGKVSAVAVP